MIISTISRTVHFQTCWAIVCSELLLLSAFCVRKIKSSLYSTHSLRLMQMNINEKLNSLLRGIAKILQSSGDERYPQSNITLPAPGLLEKAFRSQILPLSFS